MYYNCNNVPNDYIKSTEYGKKKKQLPEYLSAFPLGEENVQYARFFIGKSYLGSAHKQ